MFCPTLECPSDASYLVFVLVCGVLMAFGFACIVALAGGLIDRDTFENKDE